MSSGHSPRHLQHSPDAAWGLAATVQLLLCLQAIPQAGDRQRAPLCNTASDISLRKDLFKQSLLNNHCFIYIISEHSWAWKHHFCGSKTPCSALAASAAGHPPPRQPQWTDKEPEGLGAIRQQEATELGNLRSCTSTCVAHCTEALKAPMAYARFSGISGGIQHVKTILEPQTSQLTGSHEIRHEACQNPSHESH